MNRLFSHPNISIAIAEDIAALTRLLNGAYRGESSRLGWTTEADLIAGDTRTNEQGVQQVIEQEGSVMLKYCNEAQEIIGCVNLQQRDQRLYLGMFSVLPQLQGAGVGKQLLLAAEEHAKLQACNAIYMWVIAARVELISWYQRHGYQDTGERIPFAEDGISGIHLQKLAFMVLEKRLTH